MTGAASSSYRSSASSLAIAVDSSKCGGRTTEMKLEAWTRSKLAMAVALSDSVAARSQERLALA